MLPFSLVGMLSYLEADIAFCALTDIAEQQTPQGLFPLRPDFGWAWR